MSYESISTIIREVDTSLWDLISHVLCSICHELPVNPVTTPCEHSFCCNCIKRFLSSKDNSGCPLCKHPLKKYSLQQDMVKLKISRIFQELPQAFISDVKDLQSSLNGTTSAVDLTKTSKLFQLSVLENQAKSVKTNEKKLSTLKSIAVDTGQNKGNDWINDNDENGEVETFVPVVKRDKNAKEKKFDDLISISQTETVSSLSGFDLKELNDDLAGIERVPPCEKVKQWFQSTGDGSTPKISDSTGRNSTSDEAEIKCNERHCSSSMIRVDYKKFLRGKECGAKIYVDPYEFVSSQSNKVTNKKRNNLTGKIKLDKKGTNLKDNVTVITESQKFNQLRAESDVTDGVQTERREHTLFSGTQPSSVHFSDCSSGYAPQCGSEDGQNKKTGPDIDGASVGLFTNCRKTWNTEESDVTLDRENSSIRNSYTDIIRLKSYEALELENDVETYLKRFGGDGKRIGLKETKKKSGERFVTNGLLNLLEEVYLDDALYSNHPVDAPLKLPGAVKERNVSTSPQETFTSGKGDYSERENSVLESFQSCENLTSTSNLIGFGTQHSVQLPPRKILRNMIADMEKDLRCRERDFFQGHETISTAVLNNMMITMTETTVSADKEEFQGNKSDSSDSVISPGRDDAPENPKGFIKFLRAGHLTPFPRRARSSVVKLVFPAGLGRKRFSRAASAHVQPSIHGSPIAGPKTLCSCQKKRVTAVATFAEPKSRIIICSKAIQTSPTTGTTQADERRIGKETEYRGTEISRKAPFPGKTDLERSGGRASTGVQTSPVATASISVQASTPLKLACSVAVQTLKFEFEVVRDSAKTLDEDPCNAELTRTDSLENDNIATLDALPLAQFSAGTQKRKMEEGGARVSKKPKTREHILNVDDEKSTPNKHRDILAPDHDSAALLRSNLIGHVNSVSQNKGVNHFSGKTTSNYQNSSRKEVKKKCKESTEEWFQKSGLVFEVDAQNPNPNRNISVDPSTLQKGFLHVTDNGADAEEKSEESDSDLFVEQTPPRGSASAVAERRRFEGRPNSIGEMRAAVDDSREKVPKNVRAKKMEPTPNALEPQGGRRETQGNAMARNNTNNLEDSREQSPWPARAQGNPPKENLIARAVSDTWKKFDFGRGRKASLPHRKRFHLVASSVHNPDKIKKFASAFNMEYSSKANKDMTHLIVGLHENDDGEVLPLCTPKLLFAMANKKWVVSEAWAEASLKASKVVDENEFETRDPLGGSACRTARLSNERLFKTCQICLLGTFENILKEELADLVVDSGGTLVSRPESFSLSPSKMRLIIADGECLSMNATELQCIHERFRSVVLSRDFLIMSIQSQKLSIFSPYLLHPASPENLIEMGYPAELLRQEESNLEM